MPMSKRCWASWGIKIKEKRKKREELMNLSIRLEEQSKFNKIKTKLKKKKKSRTLSQSNHRLKQKSNRNNSSRPKNHKYIHNSLKRYNKRLYKNNRPHRLQFLSKIPSVTDQASQFKWSNHPHNNLTMKNNGGYNKVLTSRCQLALELAPINNFTIPMAPVPTNF